MDIPSVRRVLARLLDDVACCTRRIYVSCMFWSDDAAPSPRGPPWPELLAHRRRVSTQEEVIKTRNKLAKACYIRHL